MSMSIGPVGAVPVAPASVQQQESDAVAVSSLRDIKREGAEAVDLIRSATLPPGRLVDTYA